MKLVVGKPQPTFQQVLVNIPHILLKSFEGPPIAAAEGTTSHRRAPLQLHLHLPSVPWRGCSYRVDKKSLYEVESLSLHGLLRLRLFAGPRKTEPSNIQRLLVIWGQCCLRVGAGPCLPNGPNMHFSPYLTWNPCTVYFPALYLGCSGDFGLWARIKRSLNSRHWGQKEGRGNIDDFLCRPPAATQGCEKALSAPSKSNIFTGKYTARAMSSK